MNLDTSVGNLDVANSEFAAIITSISLYGTITVVGLVSITLFLAVQIVGRKVFAEFPFFTIIWYLTLINLLHLLTQAFVIFPCMLIEMPDNGPWAIWQSAGVILVDFTDQTIMYFTLLMALNRFAVFVWKQLQEIFSTYHVKKIIWMTILLVIPIVAYRMIFGTKKRFNKSNFNITNVNLGSYAARQLKMARCVTAPIDIRYIEEIQSKTLNFDDILLTQSDDLLINIISASLYILPLINLAFYLVIYIYLRKQRSRTMYQKGDKDMALLYQALAVSICLEVTRMVSVSAPMLRTDTWVRWVLNIARSVCSILNHSLNPILFLTTNQTVRGVLRKMLPKRCHRILFKTSLTGADSHSAGEKVESPSPVQIVMTL